MLKRFSRHFFTTSFILFFGSITFKVNKILYFKFFNQYKPFSKMFFTMRKIFTLLSLIFCGFQMYAQQDPMFTNYLFNSLTINPGYAGSNEHLTINALHRTQWWGIQGAPSTQTFTVSSPLQNDKVGVGFNLINDKIGPTTSLDLGISYAYRIPVGKSKLSIGLQGSYNNFRADFVNNPTLNIQVPDNAYDQNINVWKPNLGAGVYFYNKNFYVGLSVPRIIEQDLTQGRTDQVPIYSKTYRHYYFTIGTAIPLKGDNLIFKPSLLIKSAAFDSRFKSDPNYIQVGAPTEANIDLSLFFQKTLWIGASFRSAIEAANGKSSFDSVDFWTAYYLSNGLRLGLGYDYTLTKLQTKAGGSFEIMAGYEFDFKTKRVVTPRYF